MTDEFYRKQELYDSLWTDKSTETSIRNIKDSTLFIYFKNEKFKNGFTSIDKNNVEQKKIFRSIIKKLACNNGKYYVDELMPEGIKRKPFVDAEIYYNSEKDFKKHFKTNIKKLQKDIIEVFSKKYEIDINKSDILLLDSSGDIFTSYKYSIHAIVNPKKISYYYRNGKNSDSSGMHLYSSLVELDKNYSSILDPCVYKTDATLRIIGSHKNKNDKRVPKPIDPDTFDLILLDEKEMCDYLLTYFDNTKKSQKIKTPCDENHYKSKSTKKYNPSISTSPLVCENRITKLARKYHPTAKYLGPQDNFYRFSYENRKEACPVTGHIHDKNGFYIYEMSDGFYLRCHSDRCKHNDPLYIGPADEMDEYLESAIQINSKFILESKEIPEHLDKWNELHKLLCIKSAMGTGKTWTIEYIIKHYEFKKILWITHRQSLTKSLYGHFKKFGFENYMNVEGKLNTYDRIFVQIDSLERLINYDMNTRAGVINKYDLVIIDEIESCLNHFNSPFLNNNRTTSRTIFNLMTTIINSVPKLLIMDADVNLRTKLFIENFNSSTIIYNKYKPIQKTFTIITDKQIFENNIYKDVNEGKNICIVSMSASKIDRISERLKELDVKYIIHTSKSDDKLKDKLENVNKFWVKYQVVLFSPSVESGIDFNIPHFDKVYSIMIDGQGTCTQHQHLQQIGRIRNLINNNVLCWYATKRKKYNLNAHVYTYNDMLLSFNYYGKLINKQILQAPEYEPVCDDNCINLYPIIPSITLFDKIFLHNEAEQLNKHGDIFLTILNRLIIKAGNVLNMNRFEEQTKKKNKNPLVVEPSAKEILIQKLMSVDEKKYDINDLCKKQSKNKLTTEEKYVLQKYFFRKMFMIDKKCTEGQMKKYLETFLDKEIKLHRYFVLFGYKQINKNDLETFSDGKELTRIKIITDIVNILTRKKNKQLDDNKLIGINFDQKTYTNAIINIVKKSIYFKNEGKCRPLFIKKKGKLKPFNDINKIKTCAAIFEAYSKTIIYLLKSYNIELRSSGRVSKNGKREHKYSLTVDEQLKGIITKYYERKYEIDFTDFDFDD